MMEDEVNARRRETEKNKEIEERRGGGGVIGLPYHP